MKKRAFTLIELLVVISIIALLLAIMMPALTKVKELARKIVCGHNLHEWGVVSFAFAIDHDGYLPRAYAHGDTTQPETSTFISMPFFINDTTSDKTLGTRDEETDGSWKYGGTPWSTLERYGLTEDICLCPAQKWLGAWNNQPSNYREMIFASPNAAFDTYWRRQVKQSYMLLSGISDTQGSFAEHNYRHIKPYHRKSTNPSLRVLAADTVCYVAPGSGWDNGMIQNYNINHPDRSNSARPAYQNLTYGDGHVETHESSYYKEPIERTTLTFGFPVQGPWYYWEVVD